MERSKREGGDLLMVETPNLKLKKLGDNSIFSVEEIDKNMDIIDEEVGRLRECQFDIEDYWITESTLNPAVKWPGTTWEKLEGRIIIGAGGAFALKSQGGAVSIALAIANIPRHTHSFSATTNTTGNHNHKSGNHRHRVDNHAHTQPLHVHSVNASSGYDGGPSGPFTKSKWGSSGSSSGNMHSAGGETTGGSAPYTDYQNPTSDTKGNHSHTLSGTTSSSGSGSSFSILNPYRAANIWRRTA